MIKVIVYSLVASFLFYACSSSIIKDQESQKAKPAKEKENPQKALDKFIEGSIADLKGDHAAAILEYQEALESDRSAGIYFALAKDYFLLNKLSLAIKNARHALMLDSDNVEYYNLIASIYENARMNDSAALAYEKIIELDSNNVNAYYNLGLLYEQVKPMKALTIYKKLLDITGPEWSVLVRVAELYERLNNIEESIGTIKQLSEIDPSNIELQKLLAETYIKAKKYDEALTVINDVMLLFPEDSRLIEIKGQIYLQQNNWQEAAKSYNIILNKTDVPLESKIRIGAAFVIQATKDSTLYAVAKDIFEKMDKDTVNWQIKMFLGEIALREKHDSSAIEYFKQVTDLAGWNGEAWIRLGGIYFDNKKYSEASDFMRTAVKRFPDDFAINLILGLSLTQLNKFEEAKDYLKKAVQLNPSDLNALSAYGYALNQLKEPDKAIYYLNEALKIDDDNVELLGTLGLIYNTQKKWKECDSVYLKALSIDSTNALVLNNYAYSLAERGIKLPEALKMAEQAVTKDPDNSSYLDTYGWIYYQLGDYNNAEQYIEKAIALDNGNATLLEHLGDVKYKIGKKEQAFENWQKAYKLNSDNPELKQKIEKGAL